MLVKNKKKFGKRKKRLTKTEKSTNIIKKLFFYLSFAIFESLDHDW